MTACRTAYGDYKYFFDYARSDHLPIIDDVMKMLLWIIAQTNIYI